MLAFHQVFGAIVGRKAVHTRLSQVSLCAGIGHLDQPPIRFSSCREPPQLIRQRHLATDGLDEQASQFAFALLGCYFALLLNQLEQCIARGFERWAPFEKNPSSDSA